MYEDYAYLIRYWFNCLTQGYDPIIQDYGSLLTDTKISSVITDQISHRIFYRSSNSSEFKFLLITEELMTKVGFLMFLVLQTTEDLLNLMEKLNQIGYYTNNTHLITKILYIIIERRVNSIWNQIL